MVLSALMSFRPEGEIFYYLQVRIQGEEDFSLRSKRQGVMTGAEKYFQKTIFIATLKVGIFAS